MKWLYVYDEKHITYILGDMLLIYTDSCMSHGTLLEAAGLI